MTPSVEIVSPFAPFFVTMTSPFSLVKNTKYTSAKRALTVTVEEALPTDAVMGKVSWFPLSSNQPTNSLFALSAVGVPGLLRVSPFFRIWRANSSVPFMKTYVVVATGGFTMLLSEMPEPVSVPPG